MVATNNSVLLSTIMYVINQSVIQDESSYNYYYMQIGKETNAKRCYGMYDCFELSPPWTSQHRPVSLFPKDLEEIDPNYFLHTRKNRNVAEVLNVNDFDYIESSSMEPMKPIYVISHGYMEGGNIFWIKDTAEALLTLEDCNVIIVDWHGGSSPPYTQAVANIRLIGSVTAHLLYDIAQLTGDLKLDHVHCIGHSLGAHMFGYVGYALQDLNLTLGRISGLDPAEPHFAKSSRPVRLDKSAAQYVDIIHTDASQFIRGSFGISESIGHVDYFPNGGSNQPGCGKGIMQFVKDEKGSLFYGMKKYIGCNHERSHQIFLDSINPKCSFLSIRCPSYQEFLDGTCWGCGKYGEKCVKFGYHGRQHYKKIHGDRMKDTSLTHYLMTGVRAPFCRGHYRIMVLVSNGEPSRKHGGEIGQLLIRIHSTSDGTGEYSSFVGFYSGYYEPGLFKMGVVATEEIREIKAIEIEFRYNTSVFNPLTWRIVSPKVYLKKVTVESLENRQNITVCPKDQKPLVHGVSQLMIPSYC